MLTGLDDDGSRRQLSGPFGPSGFLSFDDLLRRRGGHRTAGSVLIDVTRMPGWAATKTRNNSSANVLTVYAATAVLFDVETDQPVAQREAGVDHP